MLPEVDALEVLKDTDFDTRTKAKPIIICNSYSFIATRVGIDFWLYAKTLTSQWTTYCYLVVFGDLGFDQYGRIQVMCDGSLHSSSKPKHINYIDLLIL